VLFIILNIIIYELTDQLRLPEWREELQAVIIVRHPNIYRLEKMYHNVVNISSRAGVAKTRVSMVKLGILRRTGHG